MNVTPLHKDSIMRAIAFKDVSVGEEFWWGGYLPQRCNWGRKRSSKTADWIPNLSGKLTGTISWGYWKQSETVYVTR
jgi:hypothetical protein